MKKSELEQFFCLPSCDEHDEFEGLSAKAMQYASEGDAIMCMETLNKASEIAYKAIERSQVYIRTNEEPLPFVVDVSDLDSRIGGLYD